MLDREMLESMLAEGCSLEEIGRRVGRHPSTVSYWLRKFGLQATHRDRHMSRGGLPRDALEELVARGASLRQLAAEFGVGTSTVRHWLRKYGLKTARRGPRRRPEAAAAFAAGLQSAEMECERHGSTLFVIDNRGYYRCARCRSEAVARRRRRVKQILVDEAGGACQLCGYRQYVGALHFHHIDPTTKSFGVASQGIARSLERAKAEVAKCVLLCSNCHAEVEGGFTTL